MVHTSCWMQEASTDGTNALHRIFGLSCINGTQPMARYLFEHDEAGRLLSTNQSRADLEWAPTADPRTYGAVNNLNQVASETRGGTTRNNGWNPNGNMTGDGDYFYEWTFGNRLKQATGFGRTASYTYDSEDRRTSKTVTQSGVTTQTRTLWSGSEEIAQMNAAGTLTRYIIPDGSGVMDARLAIIEVSGNAITWLHTDHGPDRLRRDRHAILAKA